MYLIGLDISTTAAKALLLDIDTGKTHTSPAVDYPLSSPQPLWAEQDPHEWWQSSMLAIRRLIMETGVRKEDVAAIGLSGHMFGLVALDQAGEPVRPCIMWNDQRSSPQCDEITRRLGLEHLLDLTANSMIPGYVAPKLLWLREHEPEAYKRIAHLLFAKDYIRYKLTGEFATDVSDAPGSAMFDVARRTWSKELLHELEIPQEWLPRCEESPQVTGKLSEYAAKETGLLSGTLVVAGAGDQPAQAIGNGIVDPGTALVTIGTSGVIFVSTSQPLPHPQGLLHAFCHAVPDTWCLMGVVLSAGGSLRWYRDILGQAEKMVGGLTSLDSYDVLMAEAQQAPPGSEGLLFLPYLTGERTPYVDPNARGAWVGLTARHDRRHLVRSIIEGITFGLRDAFEMIEARNVGIKRVLVSGGGVRSPLWRQIQADILGRELFTTSETEGAALGAAILAAVGANLFPSVSTACEKLIRIQHATEPIAGNVQRYQELYQMYRELYPILKGTNDRLTHFVNQ